MIDNESEAPLKLTSFISISLDIAGSTDAKDKICSFASKHSLSLVDLYQEFSRGLLNTERNFLGYLCAVKASSSKCEFEVERLFLIKTLGDEWWYSYSLDELDDFEIAQHARHLFSALLDIQSKASAIVSIPSSQELDIDGLDHFDDFLHLELPLKITCDLISGLDIGRDRFKNISPAVASFSGNKLVFSGDKEFQQLMTNVAAVPMVQNTESGKVLSVCRSDFVGMEVDRFFRLTAKAQVGQVLVGSQLLEALELEECDAHDVALNEGWRRFLLRNKNMGGGFTTLRTHLFVNFASEEGYKLKGIANPYRAATCTDRHSQAGAKVWKGLPAAS